MAYQAQYTMLPSVSPKVLQSLSLTRAWNTGVSLLCRRASLVMACPDDSIYPKHYNLYPLTADINQLPSSFLANSCVDITAAMFFAVPPAETLHAPSGPYLDHRMHMSLASHSSSKGQMMHLRLMASVRLSLSTEGFASWTDL